MPKPHQSHPLFSLRASLAIAWAAATFLAWCLVWQWPPAASEDAAGLTAVAVGATAVSLLLRFPGLISLARTPAAGDALYHPIRSAEAELVGGAGRPLATPAMEELVWWCAWVGQINVLGIVSVLGPSFASVLPAVVVSGLVEAWLLDRAPCDWSERCRRCLARLPPRATSVEAEAPSTSADTAPASDSVGDAGPQWLRQSRQGLDASGQRYLEGWVQFQLEPGQKLTHLSVGFSPAFASEPEIELDQEPEDEGLDVCEVQLELATPAGMRVIVKRGDVRSPYRGRLSWHARDAAVIDPAAEQRALLSNRLP